LYIKEKDILRTSTKCLLFSFGGVEGNRTPVRRTPNNSVYSLDPAFYLSEATGPNIR